MINSKTESKPKGLQKIGVRPEQDPEISHSDKRHLIGDAVPVRESINDSRDKRNENDETENQCRGDQKKEMLQNVLFAQSIFQKILLPI
jgi:hypothetical protein